MTNKRVRFAAERVVNRALIGDGHMNVAPEDLEELRDALNDSAPPSPEPVPEKTTPEEMVLKDLAKLQAIIEGTRPENLDHRWIRAAHQHIVDAQKAICCWFGGCAERDRERADGGDHGAEPSTSPEPRPAVLAFARVMERKLRMHEDKGGWDHLTAGDLFTALIGEVEELNAAIHGHSAVACEAADVANYAMMLVFLEDGTPRDGDNSEPTSDEGDGGSPQTVHYTAEQALAMLPDEGEIRVACVKEKTFLVVGWSRGDVIDMILNAVSLCESGPAMLARGFGLRVNSAWGWIWHIQTSDIEAAR